MAISVCINITTILCIQYGIKSSNSKFSFSTIENANDGKKKRMGWHMKENDLRVEKRKENYIHMQIVSEKCFV